MKKFVLAAVILLLFTSITGCNTSSSSSSLWPPTPITADIWQNPFMSLNPTNNVHNDSYMSDSYSYAGPNALRGSEIIHVGETTFIDPYTGESRTVILGECAAHAFDADGNIQTYAAGLPNPETKTSTRAIITLDRETLKVLAYKPYTVASGGGTTDFSGAGYFYQDNLGRIVASLPDGKHVAVLQRQKSPVSNVDQYVEVQSYDVVDSIPLPPWYEKLSLYAVVPDKAGNIWFTTGQGLVGTISQAGQLRWLDLNDPNGTGAVQPQSDGNLQEIANSHAVDEGDSDSGPSGVYVVTTYNLYRLEASADGTPQIVWQAAYDHGTMKKPGQASFGSGSTPTLFKMGGRRFVTILDNADFMQVNVYRAEAQLQPGENRIFAQAVAFPNIQAGLHGAPSGVQPVSDENSQIVAPAPDGSGGMDIYAENNWGYTGPDSTLGDLVPAPGGFVRMRLTPDGSLTVASTNDKISVPTLVSKMSIPSQTVYTYEKQPSGWYLTGLDSQDLTRVRFSVLVGTELRFNNHYGAVSLDADGFTAYVASLTGLTRISLK
jgi:hypothetical protein